LRKCSSTSYPIKTHSICWIRDAFSRVLGNLLMLVYLRSEWKEMKPHKTVKGNSIRNESELFLNILNATKFNLYTKCRLSNDLDEKIKLNKNIWNIEMKKKRRRHVFAFLNGSGVTSLGAPEHVPHVLSLDRKLRDVIPLQPVLQVRALHHRPVVQVQPTAWNKNQTLFISFKKVRIPQFRGVPSLMAKAP